MVTIEWRDSDGNELFNETYENIIVNTWLSSVANLLGWINVDSPFDYLANGSDSTVAGATQTALISENTINWFERTQVTPTRITTTVANDTLQLENTFTATGTITVNEIWILNAVTTGVLLSRLVLPVTKSFSSGDTMKITYKIILA